MIPDLNDKEIRFCDEYLGQARFNGTQAAIRAGYSKRTAASIASEMLKKPKIQRYMEIKSRKVQDEIGVSQEMIMQELATIGFSKITDYLAVKDTVMKKKVRGKTKEITVRSVEIFPTEEIKQEAIPAIASIKQTKEGIELKTHDKVRALELMGKHRGMFKEGVTPVELNVRIE